MDEPQPSLVTIVPLLVLDIAISLVVAVPIAGVLVRYRANYSPKAVRLDAESEGASARAGPVVGGFFAMFRRVYRLEGWAGLYKGFMPSLLVTLFISFFAGIALIVRGKALPDPDVKPKTDFNVPVMFAVNLVALLVALPITVVTYRAITTPYRLPYFGFKTSIRALTTPTERSRPWKLYLIPGLVLAHVLQLVLAILVLVPLQRLVLPTLPRSKEEWHLMGAEAVLRAAGYVVLVVLGTTTLVPFEVMGTRLALQRNHAQTGLEIAPENSTAGLKVYSAEQDVIGVRDESDPYLSLVDCAKRIVNEEGRSVLFRAWWITFLPLIAAGVIEAAQRSRFWTTPLGGGSGVFF